MTKLRSYKQIKLEERRNKLENDSFTQEEINSYVKNLNKIAKRINIRSGDIKVVYTNNYEELADLCKLTDTELQHSWAGEEWTKERGYHLYGDFMEWGKYYSYEYSDNGNTTNYRHDDIDPNFNTNSKYVVFVTNHRYSNFNGSSYYDKFTGILMVYDKNLKSENCKKFYLK